MIEVDTDGEARRAQRELLELAMKASIREWWRFNGSSRFETISVSMQVPSVGEVVIEVRPDSARG